ncbi:MAG: transcriptional repressor [Dactylosporangium sp.]|nr:transcriptional repressor [Dactylosporangium sp.]NNJ62536.1 transcriptional repressor [Dactylosporangium sp.]
MVAVTEHRVTGLSRNTRQRNAVIALLQETCEFRSAQQLHADLRGRGAKVGLTTVYRTLQTLTELGELDAIRLPSGEQIFRRCSRYHHHHLVCRICTHTIEIAGPNAVESWTERVAAEHGFTEVEHTLEIFGICQRCLAERAG